MLKLKPISPRHVRGPDRPRGGGGGVGPGTGPEKIPLGRPAELPEYRAAAWRKFRDAIGIPGQGGNRLVRWCSALPPRDYVKGETQDWDRDEMMEPRSDHNGSMEMSLV